MSRINIGDHVICRPTGVSGTVVKQYFPTACEQQTMIQCADGRLYHAPTRLFVKVDHAELEEPILQAVEKLLYDLLRERNHEKIHRL